MQFNSFQFAIFFITFYIIYLLLNHKWQNRMLLIASCIFYSLWDWRFLGLIFSSIVTDYICSLRIHQTDDARRKKFYLLLSIFINLSILGFFKYFNFFLDNLDILLRHLGIVMESHLLRIILPVGISFYTFKTMSYTIDVYREEIKPTRSFLNYATFIAFFPQIIAGPITKAKDFLPQINSPRKISLYGIYSGIYLIIWGLFQKCVVADNLAIMVNSVFLAPIIPSGFLCLLAIYGFAFQIYCDFAGYSNIARGLGNCMGFKTMINFNLPYISTNPAEFWRRWHISFSNWLRDYLYMPLVLSKRYWREWGISFALIVTFFVCGLWHGAAWTFVIWGAYQGMLLIANRLLGPLLAGIPSPNNVFLNKVWSAIKIALFFHVTCFGWLIFRAENMAQVSKFTTQIFRNFHQSYDPARPIFCLLLFVGALIFYEKINGDDIVLRWNDWKAPLVLTSLVLIIITMAPSTRTVFLYFRF